MDVRLPDGTIIRNVPEGTTRAQLVERMRAGGMAVPAEWLEEKPPVVETQAEPLRQPTLTTSLGRTARSAMVGPAAALSVFTEPIRYATDKAYEFVTGRPSPSMPLGMAASQAADAIGLPEGQTPLERIVDKGTELGFGTLGFSGLLSKFGPLLNDPAKITGLPTVAQDALRKLSNDPLGAVVTATGGGMAGQQAKEAGAGPLEQGVAAFGGSLLSAGALGGMRSAVDAVKSRIPTFRVANEQSLNFRIDGALQNAGIDPKTLDPAMRRYLLEQARAAMKTGGGLSDDALVRLADYRRLNVTPTKGRLTLDPYDVTQEQNAAKFAAATGARDARLPQISQENNQRLLSIVDDFGPTPDRYNAGAAAKAPIAAFDETLKRAEGAAYQAARDMAGGDIPLVRGPVLQAINKRLDEELKGPFVPSEVQTILNRLQTDPNVPFTVGTIDNLKTIIASAQRATADGNVKRALSIIRDQLDTVPVEPLKRSFGANQVVTQATADRMTSADKSAAEVKAALDQARQFAFKRRSWQESSPVIEDVVNGISPEDFVQKHLLSRARGFDDLAKAAPIINGDPAARNAVRGLIVQYLKESAIGKGNDTQTANFSGRGWLSGLNNIGDKKLGLFFDAEELETLKSVGRVGAIETFQPRGSAVNNSNTAAGLAQMLQGLSKYVSPMANKVPFGAEAISAPVNSLTLSMLQRPALNVPSGLLSPSLQPRDSALDAMVLPLTVMGGGLLSQ